MPVLPLCVSFITFSSVRGKTSYQWFPSHHHGTGWVVVYVQPFIVFIWEVAQVYLESIISTSAHVSHIAITFVRNRSSRTKRRDEWWIGKRSKLDYATEKWKEPDEEEEQEETQDLLTFWFLFQLLSLGILLRRDCCLSLVWLSNGKRWQWIWVGMRRIQKDYEPFRSGTRWQQWIQSLWKRKFERWSKEVLGGHLPWLDEIVAGTCALNSKWSALTQKLEHAIIVAEIR